MDINSIGAALSSIKTAADLAKIIRDSSSSLEQAEVKFKLAELIGALAEAKMDIASIRELILDKDKEIFELKGLLEIKEKVIWEKPYYFLIENSLKDGPYCPTCYDNQNKMIRLQDKGNGCWSCHVCNCWLQDSTYRPIDLSSSSDGWI